jgi:tetratricopeptide (TPR) repeat protein
MSISIVMHMLSFNKSNHISIHPYLVDLIPMSKPYGKKADREALFETCKIYHASGKWQQTIDFVNQHDGHFGEWKAEAVEFKAKSLYQLGQYAPALACWNQIKSRVERYESNLIWHKVDCLVKLGQFKTAEATYERLLESKDKIPVRLIAQHRIKYMQVLKEQNNKNPKLQKKLMERAIPHLTHPDDVELATTRLKELEPLLQKRKKQEDNDDEMSNKKRKLDEKENEENEEEEERDGSECHNKDEKSPITTRWLGEKLETVIQLLHFKCTNCGIQQRNIRFHCGHVLYCHECAEQMTKKTISPSSVASSSSAASSSSSGTPTSCPKCNQPCEPFLPVLL